MAIAKATNAGISMNFRLLFGSSKKKLEKRKPFASPQVQFTSQDHECYTKLCLKLGGNCSYYYYSLIC